MIVVADNDTRKVLGLVISGQTKRWAPDAGDPFYPSLSSVMLPDVRGLQVITGRDIFQRSRRGRNGRPV